MSKVSAFLDACVLYPNSVRDILMQLSVDGFYRARWSQKAEDEFVRNVEKNNPELKGKLGRVVSKMRAAIPDYSVECSDATLDSVLQGKTDKKDAEILAAAIDGECNLLITYNLKDFDTDYASQSGVTMIHPDAFLYELVLAEPARARTSLNSIVSRFKNPPRTAQEFCEALRVNKLRKTADQLEED